MKKHLTTHLIFAATALASQQALALGFGRVVSDAVLGEAFTVTVPVHVEPGARFGADCVSAQVYYGESMLPASAVRTQVDAGASNNDWVVRISAATAISEPVIEVAVSAGCEQRFLRRFTVFADPPMASTARIAAPTLQSGASALAPDRSAAGRTSATAPGSGAAASGEHLRVGRRKGPTMALANELNAPKAASATAPPRHATVGAATADTAPARKPGPRVAPAPADAPRLVLDGGYAHLKLDMEEPLIPAAAAASGSAAAASELDDGEGRQLHALEQSIEALKRNDQAAHDQTARLRAQLAEAQTRGEWLPWVAGLLALAVAAAAALAWKMRQQSRLAHGAWFNDSQTSRSAPAPVQAPERPPAPAFESPAPTAPQDLPPIVGDVVLDLPPIDEPEVHEHGSGAVVADVAYTQPLDRAALAGMMAQDPSAPRELSVEELLDLEQQADFFIALGQEDAAVDLLMSHLRSAGGQSPLPYTKLLEIYRRQGDRSAYERTRARFNRRFNAYAPDWDTGPAAGRTLDDYPETVALIQAAWASPIDAMVVLEGLLFKRDDTSELFDLPAYRDVLVLYSLARDLWQQGGGAAGTQVDVLLPLDDPYGVPPTAHPSSAANNALGIPLEVGGLDDGFEATRMSGGLDLEIPSLPDVEVDEGPVHLAADDDVHATLDAFSLAPIQPTRPPPSPLDWDAAAAKPSPDDIPTKR